MNWERAHELLQMIAACVVGFAPFLLHAVDPSRVEAGVELIAHLYETEVWFRFVLCLPIRVLMAALGTPISFDEEQDHDDW